MASPEHLHTASSQEIVDHESDWAETWNEFNIALRSPEPFNAFMWVCRLGGSAVRHTYLKSGLVKFNLHKIWRPLLPMFCILLITSIVSSYFFVLRAVIYERWCCALPIATNATDGQLCSEDCGWMVFHDSFVVYLGAMILYSFMSACFRSPGVVLAADVVGANLQSTDEQTQPTRATKWKAMEGQGGCFIFDATLDIFAEQRRSAEWEDISKSASSACRGDNNDEIFPGTDSTFCDKCRVSRPPRCHHCSICRRCVLQFDHHCMMLNNCVGYNNYRSFVLTLFFLCLGCWYGAVMLFAPFNDQIQNQFAANGFAAIFSYRAGAFDIPTPWSLMQQLTHGQLDPLPVVRIVFPIVFAMGVIQAAFLASHVRYIVTACTTLEHKILLDWDYNELVRNRNAAFRRPTNPYDNGWYHNILRTLGPNWLLLFLPITVEPQPVSLKKSN